MMHRSRPEHPVASVRLANLSSSSLPNDVKAALAAAVTALKVLTAKDPEAAIPPSMLLAVNALHGGGTILSVDLLRVLLGNTPHVRSHRAQNIGAVLRGKRKQLGRPPITADFPVGRVNLFASAYWGGIDAWAAGAPGREQKPKNFWRNEANQVEALTTFARQHPGRPITTLNLANAGYPALAIALRGADLDGLVARAGLGVRQLTRDPKSRQMWTADVVLDRYVTLCRQHQITLSTSALLALGGEASTLRGHARRLFGSFGAMVDAALARAPDLRPLNRPTATDGTLLDSWSEVVVWNAVRNAFPGVTLRAHVLLPGETARSVDILVEDGVYLEVLMIGVAGMAMPTSRTQIAYGLKWAAKSGVYAALGIMPIVIEPCDVHDSARLALRMAEVGRGLDTTPRPPSPPKGKETRAKGSWDKAALHNAVREVARRVGAFPTYAQLTEHGYGHAGNLLRRPGMRQRVADQLRITLVHRRHVWDRGRVVAELLAWVKAHGRYPSVPELIQGGRSDLVNARNRLARGEQEAVRAEVEALWGKPLRRQRRQDGCYATLVSIAELLRPLAETLGHIPTLRECTAAGLGSAWYAMSRLWGVAVMAAHLGLPKAGQRARGQRLL